MPISEAERCLFYEVLDIPNDTSVIHIDGAFGTGRKIINYAVTTAKTEIDERLDALTGAPLTRLQSLLARWECLSTSADSIVANGSNEGAKWDARRERALIKRRILTIVPVFVSSYRDN